MTTFMPTTIPTADATAITTITSKDEMDALLMSKKPLLVFFWADWHEPSKVGGQMHDIFEALHAKYNKIVTFLKIEAEAVPLVSEQYQITVVPTFIAIKDGKAIDRLEGANPGELSKLAKKLYTVASATATVGIPISADDATIGTASNEPINTRLVKLINTDTVMLFMKGSPASPKCGFSRQICEILKQEDIAFASFDILTDEEVRSGLKVLSDWPTYPQLYVKGALVGGLDIIKEMKESGSSLKEQLEIC